MNLPEYSDSFEQEIAKLAFVHRTQSNEYENDFDALFSLCVIASRMYVEAWAAIGANGSPAQFVIDADDAANPERIADPKLAVLDSLVPLYLDALEHNTRWRLGVLPT